MLWVDYSSLVGYPQVFKTPPHFQKLARQYTKYMQNTVMWLRNNKSCYFSWEGVILRHPVLGFSSPQFLLFFSLQHKSSTKQYHFPISRFSSGFLITHPLADLKYAQGATDKEAQKSTERNAHRMSYFGFKLIGPPNTQVIHKIETKGSPLFPQKRKH